MSDASGAERERKRKATAPPCGDGAEHAASSKRPAPDTTSLTATTTTSTAGAAPGEVTQVEGHTYHAESGWYVNDLDPDWLYDGAALFFQQSTQQYSRYDAPSGQHTPVAADPDTPAAAGAAGTGEAVQVPGVGVESGLMSMQGRRATQEDRHVLIDSVGDDADLRMQPARPLGYWGVYDGHLGAQASEHLEKELHVHVCRRLCGLGQDGLGQDDVVRGELRQAFLEVDTQLLRVAKIRKRRDGSCAVVGALVGRRLYVANVGDSRAVLCVGNRAVPVSTDHKPDRPDEASRIAAAGGQVVERMGVPRVMRVADPNRKKQRNEPPALMLAVSRAFGDRELKVPTEIITADPELFVVPLEAGEHRFLILACDGVWDVLSDQEAVDLALPLLERPQEAAAAIVRAAYEKMSEDNISVVVVRFLWPAAELGAKAGAGAADGEVGSS